MEQYALRNVNVVLSGGEKVGIVGENGAGKSTFVKLLLRLYDVSEGEILLNGVNIKIMIMTNMQKFFLWCHRIMHCFSLE